MNPDRCRPSRTRPAPQSDGDRAAAVPRQIIINSTPQEARVATMENARLLELQLERMRERSIAGSICKGRVMRVLPGMQAAFVDIGLEKAAFLPGADFFPLSADEYALQEPTFEAGGETAPRAHAGAS